MREDNPIEVMEWEPVPGKPGTSQVKRWKTVDEVFKAIEARLPEGFVDEYFSVSHDSRGEVVWPNPYRRIVVFPVTGGSEGHYVHVEVLDMVGGRQCVMLLKTFEGWDSAWEKAKFIGQLLEV
jgi:hypothetical protein